MAKICAFFGHRDIPEDLEPLLRKAVIQAITQYGVTEFWNGCYGEFDVLAAQVVISLKAQYPQIRLVQVYAYPPTSTYTRMGFDRAFYPDTLLPHPDHTHIPRRNIWMATQCAMAIAYVDHSASRIHEPVKWLWGKKPVINLGSYRPQKAE